MRLTILDMHRNRWLILSFVTSAALVVGVLGYLPGRDDLLATKRLFNANLFGQMEQAAQEIAFAHRGWMSLSEDQIIQSTLCKEYFNDFAEREGANADLRHQLAKAYYCTGLLYQAEWDLPNSIEAYEKSIETIASLAQVDRGISNSRATVQLLRSTALANSGRIREASDALQFSISEFEELRAVEGDTTVDLMLAAAYRNQAILFEAAGIAPTEAIASSVKAAHSARERQDSLNWGFESELDSIHVQAELYFRHHDYEQSAATLEHLIQRLEEFLEELSKLYKRRDIKLARQRYIQKLEQAKSHLAIVNRHAKDSSSVFTNEPWVSEMLSWQVCTMLTMERFFQASIPPEFEQQDALLLSWKDWAMETQLQLIETVSPRIKLIVLVDDRQTSEFLQDLLAERRVPTSQVHVEILKTDTVWTRDYGPEIAITRGGQVAWIDTASMDFGTESRDADADLAYDLARSFRIPRVRTPLYMEGGGILTNGDGVVAVASRIVDHCFSRGMTKEELRDSLHRYWGPGEIVDLQSLSGEKTGHLDWFATFPKPDTIIIGQYGAEDPENMAILNSNARLLSGLETTHGPLQVQRIPMPPHEPDFFGGSYTNVVYANGLLLVPSWKNAPKGMEDHVRKVYQDLLPDWEIQFIESTSLGRRNGSLHCLTKQIRLPAETIKEIFEDS